MSVLILVMLSFEIVFTPSVRGIRSGIYVDNGIDQTIIEKRITRSQSEEVQHEILQLMGVYHLPKIIGLRYQNESANNFLLQLYKSLVADEQIGEMKDSNMVKYDENIISREDAMAIDDSNIIMTIRNQDLRDGRIWFDVPELLYHEHFQAELRIFKQRNSFSTENCNKTMTAHLFQIVVSDISQRDETRFHSSVDFFCSYEGWIVINITSLVQQWIKSPDKNRGLKLTISMKSEDKNIPKNYENFIRLDTRGSHQPFLVVYVSAHDYVIRRYRTIRSTKVNKIYNGSRNRKNPYTEHRRSHGCQRKTLFISFRDLGWQEWVIAPDGFAAFYCDGICSFPLNAHMNATNHAIVQTLVHIMNPHLIPKAKCAPKSLSPISVLYYDDDNNVILKKFPNMMIKSCGCH